MKTGKVVGLIIAGFFALIIIGMAIDLGTGYFGVFKTKTVGKAQQNAERVVFEQTQSYVEGKRQELTKHHLEWVRSDSIGKKAIEFTIQHNFANFDRTKLNDPDLELWLQKIMGF